MLHRYFRKYLHRMVKAASPYCLYEEGEVIDDVEHTVFGCARRQSFRSVLMSIIGMIPAANIVGILRLKKRDLEAAGHVGVPA